MRILPAGVPSGLSRFGQRVREAAANTPLFFIGAVIAIAVVFRLGLGAVKPAAAAEEETEPQKQKAVAAQVGRVTLPSSMVSTPEISGSASASAKPAAAAPAVRRDPAESAPKPMVRGKKPRTHGKR